MGAVVMPLFGYIVYRWLRSKVSAYYEIELDGKYRYPLYLMMFICFLFMEIFWRVILEFMIAYFDMHDALMHKLY